MSHVSITGWVWKLRSIYDYLQKKDYSTNMKETKWVFKTAFLRSKGCPKIMILADNVQYFDAHRSQRGAGIRPSLDVGSDKFLTFPPSFSHVLSFFPPSYIFSWYAWDLLLGLEILCTLNSSSATSLFLHLPFIHPRK
jgi:hypothetical protein